MNPKLRAASAMRSLLVAIAIAGFPAVVGAAEPTTAIPDLTSTGFGWLALALFVVAYGFVISEEFTHLRKSKPVVVAAGTLWIVVALAWNAYGQTGVAELLRHNLLEYSELLLFLLAAMTYVNTLEERNVFAALRAWLITRGFSFRAIYALTGAMAFVLSPLIDNLTTALVMGAVVIAVGRDRVPFIVPACINIVVAANAGGAFSPFGDITTLMVWQKGILGFLDFLQLLGPSVVNWLVPALCMGLAIPKGAPASDADVVKVKHRGFAVIGLFALTILLTVSMQQFIGLPPFVGMMTGLGLLQVLCFFIRRHEMRAASLDAKGVPLRNGHGKRHGLICSTASSAPNGIRFCSSMA